MKPFVVRQHDTIRVDAVASNLLNYVNAGPPVGSLGSPLFGQSTGLAGTFSQSANRQVRRSWRSERHLARHRNPARIQVRAQTPGAPRAAYFAAISTTSLVVFPRDTASRPSRDMAREKMRGEPSWRNRVSERSTPPESGRENTFATPSREAT